METILIIISFIFVNISLIISLISASRFYKGRIKTYLQLINISVFWIIYSIGFLLLFMPIPMSISLLIGSIILLISSFNLRKLSNIYGFKKKRKRK